MSKLRNYLVLDTETNDFANAGGQAIQIGWCLVEDTKVIDSGHVNLRPAQGLRMSDSAQKIHGLSLEYLTQHGHDGTDALRAIVDERLLWFARERGYAVLGHNLPFDMQALDNACDAHNAPRIHWDRVEQVDTSMLVKAERLCSDWAHAATQQATRHPDEPIAAYLQRIRGMWITGLKFNLDLSLERYGINLVRQAHNAEEDCIATHLVFEALRQRGVLRTLLCLEDGVGA